MCRPIVWMVAWMAAGSCDADQTLLLVGQPTTMASLVGGDEDGVIHFRAGDQTRRVSRRELVRWGTPRANLSNDEVILVDGTRIVLAAGWTGQPTWQVTAETVSVRTELLGDLSFPIEKLRAILLNAPTDAPRRRNLTDQLIATPAGQDRVVMVNGDLLEGKLLPDENGIDGSAERLSIALGPQQEPVVVPLARLAGIAFDHASQEPASGLLAVGLRDGSALHASAVNGGPERIELEGVCGMESIGADLRDVVYLRSADAGIVYLSDRSPEEYRHVPYLDLPWPLRVDRNALGQQLMVGGRLYPKGLGMHTASRATYDLKKLKKRQRFVASVAVDDAAQGRGSVIFRVYLLRGGRWQPAYSSPVVRGGDEPTSVSVELNGASQIALVSDYADRGDERDYANWLDARLE